MSKTVRAKFECNKITNDQAGQTIEMGAVYSEEEGSENKKFTEYTPCGNFDMRIDKEAPAFGSFEVGKQYYFDITEAPAE